MRRREGCPIREDAESAVRSGEDFARSLKRLRRQVLACRSCPRANRCSLLASWNSQVQAAIQEISEEWNLAGTL